MTSNRRPMRSAIASVLLLLAAVGRATPAVGAAVADPHLESVKEIYAWVDAAPDGFVTKKQSVSRMVENDINMPLIVFATEDIAKNELLVQTPWSHIIGGEFEDDKETYDWWCGTTRKLADEMKKGADSFYAPYVMYLNDEPNGQLPSQYSLNAKKLLDQLLGEHPDVINRGPFLTRKVTLTHWLMPQGITENLEEHWFRQCLGNRDDAIEIKAAAMVMQRADDHILIPAYDAFNHRNNDKHNEKEYMNARTLTTMEKYHQTFALRDIKKGEQIFISYNMCEQCGGRTEYGFGTPEMYREYGFVEWFPQRWYYMGFGDYDSEAKDMDLNQFDLYKDEDSGNMTVVWTHLTEYQDTMDRFKLHLVRNIQRLKRLKNIEWATMYSWNDDEWEKSGISSYEWSNINQFLDANIVAMTLALEDARSNPVKFSPEPDEDEPQRLPLTVTPEEMAKLLGDGNHYNSLEEPENDDLSYFRNTCENKNAFTFSGYVEPEAPFLTDRDQILGFSESFLYNVDPDAVDVCYDVNNIVEMCSSYRPYHSEYLIHAAARYVETVKRVVFVGSGDSILLHEIMKYPDLELVVGLELDQMLTRKSFRHFQTDPYFHDPRVDWWFGDAAKSLLVLPESYWGSFDLVLVDLSGLILSDQLTEDLDMLSALGMLSNPDTGVIVTNELHLAKFAEVFNYSMELFYESPLICSQTLAFGSNGVDFFHAPIYDHGIADMGNILFTTALDGAEDRHDMMHDFRTKPGITCTGDEHDTVTNNVEEDQTTAHGVLELVTLEHLKSPLDSLKIIAKSIETCIEGVGGFTIVNNGVHYEEEPHGLALIVMEEGYVVARIQQNENAVEDDENSFYVGFDVYLWSQTHRIETLKNTFLKAYGSEDVSSHKIVVGGMFGTKTWKEDAKHVGPMSASSSKRICDSDDKEASTTTGSGSSSSSSFDIDSVGGIAIEEAVSLTLTEDVVAAVFCGSESSDDSCISLDVLKDHKLVKEVIPIYECSSAGEDDIQQLYACERKIIEELEAKLGSTTDKLHMFVLDSDASQRMHQIANSIFDTFEHRETLLESHSIAVTWSSNDDASSNEPWRWEFLDRYRKQIHHDPVKLGEFVIRSGENKAYRFGIVSTNDPGMNARFDSFEKQVQNRLPEDARVELRNIHGGLYNYNEDHTLATYSQKDYDNTLAEEHFERQVPLARQTIFQYEVSDEAKKLTSRGLGLNADFVEKLIFGSSISEEEGDFDSVTKHRYPVGTGCVFLMFGERLNIVTVWDGRDRVDVNFVSSGSISSALVMDTFDARLQGLSPMIGVAVDAQPRGLGRVVNFPEDLVAIDRLDAYAGTKTKRVNEEENVEDDDYEDDDYEDDATLDGEL